MHTTRTGIACALCHTPTTEVVYLVLSAQSPFPQREDVKDRWCPAGCHLPRPEQWKEAMPPLHSSNA
ncbi:hypothetical protein [Streptomyces sp. NTH33]|uniref:hypothetical protein n=1 Tax=Streptomyces sp. NTH33 TaxID=1735453 RepID=UPI0011B9456E|nr:hypothetical protein [Streptomyces sp. NTH33]